MPIQRGDYVRPNNSSLGLPQGSVWHVACSARGLKLEAENGNAQGVTRDATYGCRFPARHFDKVVLCRGQWIADNEVDFLRGTCSFPDDVGTGRMSSSSPSPQNMPKTLFDSADAMTTATLAAMQASATATQLGSMLEAARKMERQRQKELREALAAKAKADKEAAVKAKAEEVKRQLSARLHADRCLGEATLALIAEVSRLNNGGSEHVAHSSIADHVDQLQPLAKSYGYRIVKPSLLAQVVKL